MSVTTKQVLKYALLPGIVPRMRELAGGGAGYIALYLAQIYAAVRLLPPGHPYLNPANRGRFGVHNVVTAAAGRLKFKKENCDQIIIFFLMLVGLIIFVMQFVLLGFTIFMQAAHASGLPTNFAGFFITPAAPGGGPNDDIAFVLLDRVFGVPGMFLDAGGNPTCVEDGTVGCFAFVNGSAQPEGLYPWPFHIALRAMMQFYSIGLLVIGLLIFLYFVVTVVMETAQDGVAFGRRFNHVWAPIRMVVALGLLIPVANGLNAAQYITLYAAYWGSGFATNGWNLFIAKAVTAPGATTTTPAGATNSLVATPNQPEMTNLAQFYTVANTCYAAYILMTSNHETISIDGNPQTGTVVQAYLVKPSGGPTDHKLLPYLGDPLGDGGPTETFAQAVAWEDYHDIDIVYGTCTSHSTSGGVTTHQDCDQCVGCDPDYPDDRGNVHPLCGEVMIPLEGSSQTAVATNPDPGAYFLAQQWWELTYDAWLGHKGNSGPCDGGLAAPGGDLIGRSCWGNPDTYASDTTCNLSPIDLTPIDSGPPLGIDEDVFQYLEQWGYCFVNRYGVDPPNPASPVPTNNDLKLLLNGTAQYDYSFQGSLGFIIASAVIMSEQTTQWNYNTGQYSRLGWAGAGLWYHQIARINGSLINALDDMPVVVKFPLVMEDVKKSRSKSDKNNSGENLYRNVAATDQHPEGTKTDAQGDKIASVLWQAYNAWNNAYNVNPSSNFITDIIKAITGTSGLFALTDPNNINVHPLALLVDIGKSMMNAAMINLATASGGAVVSRIIGTAGSNAVTDPLVTFAFSFGMICVGIGVLLYYIVPFMPFLYYFFAVATWIKGIFEAMVGVPLWALAHIHIDGDGLPGNFANGGYVMLMEIFLRPILIVFGLLASVVIFSAQVRVLHDIWALVTSNLAGFDTTPAASGGALMPTAGDVQSLTYYRDPIDQFFFTVIYAIIVYMLGMSSFKLITEIPSKVIRWIGTSIEAFDDGGAGMAEQFKGTMSQGVSSVSGKMNQAFSGSLAASSRTASGHSVNAAGALKDLAKLGGSGSA
jgi:hypothetical protein